MLSQKLKIQCCGTIDNSEATRNLYGQKVDQLNIRFSKQTDTPAQGYNHIYIGWAEVGFPGERLN